MAETSDFRAACRNGDLATIARLVEERETAHRADGHWQQDIHTAEQWQEELQAGLFRAAANGHAAAVDFLLSHGTQLHESAFIVSLRHVAVFEQLLNHGFDINSTEFKGEPALRLTVSHIDFLRWMLEHGADPNVKNLRGVTPLRTAVTSHKLEAAQLLLDHGAALEPDLFHQAIKAYSLTGRVSESMFRLLVEAGLDINYDTTGNGTPLHMATFYGDKRNVELLLRLGADPNIVVPDDRGDAYTPAELAKRYGHDDIHDLLKAAGVADSFRNLQVTD